MPFSTADGNFTWNNDNSTYSEAQSDCRLQGGQLASFNTQQEQADVEDLLVNNVGAGRCQQHQHENASTCTFM